MDQKLYVAACTGDVEALQELLKEDPLVLSEVTLATSNTPLHIAALLGHTEFAKLASARNPELSSILNHHGYSPIHLASSKGHLQIVVDLLNIDKRLCFLKDRNGMTPLHCATIRGGLDVIRQLLSCCPESSREITYRGETMLHLVLKNNQCELMVSLLSLLRQLNLIDELINCVDEDGNTLLHLATERKQLEIIKMLLRETKVEVDAVNGSGYTAMDISVMHASQSAENKDVGEMIRCAKAQRSTSDNQSTDPHQTTQDQYHVDINNSDHESGQNHANRPDNAPTSTQTAMNDSTNDSRPEKWIEQFNSIKNGIIVLCSLFAAFCFNAILNPPGGLWHDGPSSNITKSIQAADELKKFNHWSKSWTHRLLLNFMTANPTPKFNVSSPDLLGPNKAMIVSLEPFHFLEFLYADSVCFIASLVTIFVLLVTIPWDSFSPLAIYMMTTIVIVSAVTPYRSVLVLATNEHFATWAINVGLAPSLTALLVFYFITLLFRKEFWAAIGEAIAAVVGICGVICWLILCCFRPLIFIIEKIL